MMNVTQNPLLRGLKEDSSHNKPLLNPVQSGLKFTLLKEES